MIHAYHVILPCYRCWLPNDPRGSWSDFVAVWELARFGKATKRLEQRKLLQLTEKEQAIREAAQDALRFPPVVLSGLQALSIANGFKGQATKSDYTIWACSILPEHTHLVIARHRYKVEQVVNLLKGAATRQLIDDQRHPMAMHAQRGHRPPGMWAEHLWKVYLDTGDAIENAIAYVEANPEQEGKPRQTWSWVKPYQGLEQAWVTYW